MTWNHRDRLFALGIALQPQEGVFVLPTESGLIGISSPSNGDDAITAADPTQTGTIWDAPPIFMGVTGSGGGTIPLRGPGGTAPLGPNVWPFGIIMQACGFAEIIRANPQAATALAAGSTTSALALAASESSIDDFMIGQPIQHAAIGTGFRQTTLIQDYVGATKTAVLAETLASAPNAGSQYILPASMVYLLGTMGAAPPLFSVSVWRDKKRYDYKDCVITTWGLDTPVSNENGTTFPSLEFAMKGTPLPPVDTSTPALPRSVLDVRPPAAKGGKFFLDRIKLGHTGAKMNITLETGAASNQNQDAGQDRYDVLSGSRNLDLTLNQMNVTDFDLDARVRNRVKMPFLSTWGAEAGNRMGLLLPGLVTDPLKPTAANGYVVVGGTAYPTESDKGVALSFWY